MPAILVHVPTLTSAERERGQMSRIQQDLATHSEGSAKGSMLRRAVAGRKVSVAVVGAGFAGLRAADVLLKGGVAVTLFEARNRVGGRVSLRILNRGEAGNRG